MVVDMYLLTKTVRQEYIHRHSHTSTALVALDFVTGCKTYSVSSRSSLLRLAYTHIIRVVWKLGKYIHLVNSNGLSTCIALLTTTTTTTTTCL